MLTCTMYEAFSKDIGLPIFKYNLSLFPLGKHVITLRFKVFYSSPLEKRPLVAFSKKCPTSLQKNLKHSYVKPSNPGLVLFDEFLDSKAFLSMLYVLLI